MLRLGIETANLYVNPFARNSLTFYQSNYQELLAKPGLSKKREEAKSQLITSNLHQVLKRCLLFLTFRCCNVSDICIFCHLTGLVYFNFAPFFRDVM